MLRDHSRTIHGLRFHHTEGGHREAPITVMLFVEQLRELLDA